MSTLTFKFYSFHYLNQWLANDKKYYEALAGTKEAEKLNALKEAAAFYKVARNLGQHDKDKQLEKPGNVKAPQRKPVNYKHLLAIIDSQAPVLFQGEKLIKAVLEVENQISKHYHNGGRKVLSLTTKFLWLKVRHPIIICDSRAERALKVKKSKCLTVYYSNYCSK